MLAYTIWTGYELISSDLLDMQALDVINSSVKCLVTSEIASCYC